MLEYISNVILFELSTFTVINVFFAVFLLGESAVIAVVVAARQGFMDLNTVLIIAIIGTFLADVFWLLVGRYTPQHMLPKKLKQNVLAPINILLAKLVDKNLFLTFVFLKFLITIRLPLLLHLSRYKISWLRLLTYDFIGTLIFISTITLISIKFENFIAENLHASSIITYVLAGVVLLFIISRLLLKTLLKWTAAS